MGSCFPAMSAPLPPRSSIVENRAALKYTRAEQCRRVAWMAGRLVFQLTPRPCFALRRFILRCFGATVARGVHCYPSSHIYFPWNLTIAEDSSIGEDALIYNLGPVTIGARSTISQRAHLCAGTHDYRDPAMPLLKPPIRVGDSVWICADSFVGPGVSIGDGAVAGARSVVLRDVAPWTVVAGNPARFIKSRPPF